MFIKKVGALIAMLSLVSFVQTGFAEEDSSIARGGKLYDKWFKVIGVEKPKNTHPAWPASNTKKKGNATHRCKSCHGWDLKGKDGAYAAGSYKTGIKGLKRFDDAPNSTVIVVMKDSTHGYSGKMSSQDFTDIANFITKGQINMDAFIDSKSKKVKGDTNQGERYYNTVCAGCHEKSGHMPKDMPASLGKLSRKNPWEIFQKIQNGQPDEQMPAMRAFDLQVSVDILAHLQTLSER